MNDFFKKPLGRPPRCYLKAHRYSECLLCAWEYRCKPKPVPIQANMHFDSTLDPPEDIP